MTRKDLLPGVAPDPCPPPVQVDSRRAIIRARRRATARDIAHLILIGGIDYYFLLWPAAHVPILDRAGSAVVVAVVNAALLTHVIVVRLIPHITARRIAATWRLSERARFFQPPRP